MANGIIKWVRGNDKATLALPPPQEQKNSADAPGTGDTVKVERERNRISPNAVISDAVLVVSDEDVEIHGRWTGTKAKIQCHTLYVEAGAVVEGEIKAQRVSVRGHISGDVVAVALVVHAGALVEGNVRCDSMKVETRSRIRAMVMCDNDGTEETDLPMPINDMLDGPRLRMVNAGNQRRQ